MQIDGKEIDVPSIIPTTTHEERAWILKNANNDAAWKTAEGHAIVAKAADFAKQRIAQGKSPFAGDDESPSSDLLRDKDGNIKKFSVNDLQNMVNKSASFGNLVLSSYAQMHGNDALMKEVEGKKKEIADSHGRLATMDEYAEWEGKNPDATVAQKRTQIQKIGAKHGVSETALDKIAKEQIAEKKNPRSGLAGKETIVDGKRVYLDDEGKPTDIVAAPKERPPVDPVTGMIRQQHLDDAKSKRLSKETSDMDKKLAGEYSSEALNAIDSPDDKKKLDTKNIDAVSGYLPAEKKEELDKIRTVASRLIEEDGYTAERAVREAKAAYKKRSEKSKHEAFTHNQPGHL